MPHSFWKLKKILTNSNCQKTPSQNPLFAKFLKAKYFLKKELFNWTLSNSTIKSDSSMQFNLVLQVDIAHKNDDLIGIKRMSNLV